MNNVIHKLEKAIALGRKKGMDTVAWEEQLDRLLRQRHCVKDSGLCHLRTGSGKFKCIFIPERCEFREAPQNDMGIQSPVNSYKKPIDCCFACKTITWWWRLPGEWGEGAWVCGTCHPNPNGVWNEEMS